MTDLETEPEEITEKKKLTSLRFRKYIFVKDEEQGSVIPKQARGILSIIKEKGTVGRAELLNSMETFVKTKQKRGARRILTYYQTILEAKGYIRTE